MNIHKNTQMKTHVNIRYMNIYLNICEIAHVTHLHECWLEQHVSRLGMSVHMKASAAMKS